MEKFDRLQIGVSPTMIRSGSAVKRTERSGKTSGQSALTGPCTIPSRCIRLVLRRQQLRVDCVDLCAGMNKASSFFQNRLGPADNENDVRAIDDLDQVIMDMFGETERFGSRSP